ncbi:MAG: FAD:protein FMN transferase [Sedimentisphaerales bacterium]|nr:FAD:protein FMN transferase [Sedimentisphaerales bacterium]
MANEPKEPQGSLVTADWAAVRNIHRFPHRAMATTFEIIIQYEDKLYAQQAAKAAFDDLDRIEGQLSRYIENSDIARVNNLPAGHPLPLDLDTFACLDVSAEIWAETKGAFDVTAGFLVDCWRDEDKKPRTPTPQELQSARERTGMHLLLFDEATHAVALTRSPVRVDLGGVGKGYGVDRMAEMLREWSIERALIHGGFSSVLALDAPEGSAGWPVTLSHPDNRDRSLARLQLARIAVSGSGLEKGSHIIDPRNGRPVEGKVAAWSIATDAARADCLSTAFMVMSPEEITAYCADYPGIRSLIIVPADAKTGSPQRIVSAGPWKQSELLL